MDAAIERLLDEKAIAQMGIAKPSTLRKWRRQGKGPRFIKTGRLVRYRPADIRAFLDSRPSGGEQEARGR